MSQTIQDFYRVVQDRGIARDFQFRVFQLGDEPFNENDLVLLKTATLPGRDITNHQVTYMGLPFNMPGSATYPGSEGWEVTFHADQAYQIRNKLEQWSQRIFSDETSTGNMNVPGQDRIIDLQLMDNELNTVRKYRLVGVYVQSLGAVSYDIQGAGAPLELPATLAYQYWRVQE